MNQEKNKTNLNMLFRNLFSLSKNSDFLSRNRLILAIEIYLFGTLLLYLTGPFNYYNVSVINLISIICVYNLVFALGYVFARRRTERSSSRIKKYKYKLFFNQQKNFTSLSKVILILSILCVVIIYLYIGSLVKTLNPFLIISRVAGSLSDLGDAYFSMYSLSKNKSLFTEILSRLVIMIAPVVYFVIGVGSYYFRELKSSAKILVSVLIILMLFQSALSGQNVGVFSLVVLAMSTFWLKYDRNSRSNNKKTGYVKFGVAALLILGFLLYFSSTMLGRLKPEGRIEYFSYTPIDHSNWTLVSTPEPLKNIVIMGIFYISSGYKAVDYSFDYNFTSTFGLGNGFFAINVGKKLLDGADPFLLTYHHKMDWRWHSTINWHTAYLWFANDVGLAGVVPLMFILGFSFYKVVFLSRQKNVFAIAVLPLYMSMIIFLPCNNLILGNPGTALAFIFLNLALFFSVKRSK